MDNPSESSDEQNSEEPRFLVRLDDAVRVLAEVHSVDQAILLRDQAQLLRDYAKQRKLSQQAVDYASELLLESERKLGEMLRDMPKNTGAMGNPGGQGAAIVRSNDSTAQPPTLAEIGVSKYESSTLQKLANIPDQQYRAVVARAKAGGDVPTARRLLATLDDGTPNGQHKPKTNYSSPDGGTDPRDNCGTPPYAMPPVCQYISHEKVILDPFAGDGLMADALRALGYRVIARDIRTGHDFMVSLPDEPFDVILGNPPYSKKYPMLRRCYEVGRMLNIPFAMLLPGDTLFAQEALELLLGYGFEIIIMTPRVDYKMPNKGWDWIDEDGKKRMSSSQFSSAWFTWGLNIGTPFTWVKIDEGKRAFRRSLGLPPQSEDEGDVGPAF